jgi:hypothetical protein
MQCTVTYATAVLNSFLRFNFFLIQATHHSDILYFYLSKEMRIYVYFSEPEGVHEEKRLGSTAVKGLL